MFSVKGQLWNIKATKFGSILRWDFMNWESLRGDKKERSIAALLYTLQ